MSMNYGIVLVMSSILFSGCVGRVEGWSRFRYEWWSTFSQQKVKEIFGPFILSECIEPHKTGWSVTGEFLPKSPDGYIVLLRGYVWDKDKGWVEDIAMPWEENVLRSLLYRSHAEFEIRVSCMERELECRRIVLFEAMKLRNSRFYGHVYLNYYPLMRIETSSLSGSTPVSVFVSVCKHDIGFAGYDGRIALEVRGHIDEW